MNKRFVSCQKKILKKLLSNPEKRFKNGSNSKKKKVNNRTIKRKLGKEQIKIKRKETSKKAQSDQYFQKRQSFNLQSTTKVKG